MGWSDNWLLIIGTFTGVVGTLNAAVLRFTLQQEEYSLGAEYDRFIAEDLAIFNKLGMRGAHHDHFYKQTMMTRISMATSKVCATPLAVTLTLLLIIGLLIGATVVLWSETSQLLINSITMILESFFLIVLIEAHNIEATGHRVRLHDTLVRRLQLVIVAKRLSLSESERCAAWRSVPSSCHCSCNCDCNCTPKSLLYECPLCACTPCSKGTELDDNVVNVTAPK